MDMTAEEIDVVLANIPAGDKLIRRLCATARQAHVMKAENERLLEQMHEDLAIAASIRTELLRDLMEPSGTVLEAGIQASIEAPSLRAIPLSVLKAMLRAFAAERGIVLDQHP